MQHPRITPENRAKLREAVLAGKSIREIRELVGCSISTIGRMRRQYPAICGCGQSVGHLGQCDFRRSARDAATANRLATVIGCSRPHRDLIFTALVKARTEGFGYEMSSAVSPQKPGRQSPPYGAMDPDLLEVVEKPKSKPYSMFDREPKYMPRQNTPWRRVG